MILIKARNFLIILIIIFASSANASPDADALFAAKEWQQATSAYAEVTSVNPEDGRAWYRLAISARESGDMALANGALEKAAALQFAPIRVQLEWAKQLLVAGDDDEAVAKLREAYAAGFAAVTVLTSDPVLSGLAGNPGYDALIAAMSVQAYPCEHDARFLEFDFWVGDWEVRDAAGNLAGTNRVAKVERGCLITESWTGASGSTGFSINYLDAADGKWVQIWNSAGGTQINYRGGLTDEGMRLDGEINSAGGGAAAPFRGLWTLLPDGRVRQLFEQSNDGGVSWTTWFDGYYTRINQLE